jgi:hypothetical protein
VVRAKDSIWLRFIPRDPGICCNLTKFNKEFEAGVNDSGICGKLGIIDFAPP